MLVFRDSVDLINQVDGQVWVSQPHQVFVQSWTSTVQRSMHA
jgi:hypothetical protein